MTTKSHPQENVFVTVFRLKDQKNLKIHRIKKLRMGFKPYTQTINQCFLTGTTELTNIHA
jgi:hypothetical protein